MRAAFSIMLAGALQTSAFAAPPATSASAGPLPVVGDAALGRLQAEAEGCFECHDPDRPSPPAGQGPDTVWPRLSGQPAAYLVKQLQDFRSGERKHDFMAIMARSLGEPDVHHIAAYFASVGARAAPPGAASTLQAQGQRLYAQGDATRGIPACAGCHDGIKAPVALAGSALATPRLAGQDPRYLASQLRAWRSQERRNSPGHVMTHAAQALTDDDILALSAHLGAP